MRQQIFNADQLTATHEISKDTKTVVLTRCWSVVFDVNGNAPSDATEASFATEELAHQALELFAAMKDDDKKVHIVLNKERHVRDQCYVVHGYNFDTFYNVIEDWQPADVILTSLAGLIDNADDTLDTKAPDGIYLTNEDEEFVDI